ncbi:energy-coupling factor transport system ATP-binding protein [Sporolactobacillus spathodeae]|uniref:Energy-coupling factor transport system ATP-binding protein n=1 Tax=Sporolactobacillus spathodeae TaxID=1465502 RepID=A0ABS2Q9W8_9BACL|nr:energy-coupling factor transport system ATP-binding protein [Sporolactobacillus spathodeae]
MPNIIDVSDLSYRYQEAGSRVLDHVTLSVKQGEWLAIIGHNGSGKSTLAKCLNGLIQPEQGNVVVSGYNTKDESAIWKIRRRVGMVFQNPDNQFVGATVRDDVAFGMENHGVAREEMLQRLDEALKLVKMEAYADQEPHRLSGGQKQRVALAGIVALQPLIVILDEATSMLDPEGRRDVLETMKLLNKQRGLTVLSITHDLDEAVHADRLIVMNEGKVIRQGTPAEIFQHAELLEEIGLDLPFAVKMERLLRQRGLEMTERPLTQEGLVNALWTLRSTM